MNNNLLTLVKIEILKFFSSFNTKGKKARKSPFLYVAMVILLFCIGMSFGYSFLIISPYTKSGVDPSPAITLFAGVASTFVFMTSLSQARSIYIGDDYDLLCSLPIKKRDIVASKILTLYIIELGFSCLVMIPHGIVMIILAHNISCFLIALLLAFTLPMVPIAFALLLSLFVTMATARFKSANLVFVVLYTLMVVALSMTGVIINNLKPAQAVSGFSSIGNVIKWINPSYIFVEYSLEGNKLWLLLYVGITLIIALLSILFIVIFFDKLHDIVSSISMKTKYVRKDLKNKTEGKVLLTLEFKRLINSKIYFVNTLMGGIMTILGSTVFLIMFSQAKNNASQEALPSMNLLFIPIFILISCLIINISSPTTGSINIEGKNFWLTKSLPTDYKVYLRIKLIFAWILTIPAVLIASTIAVIFHHESAWEIIFTYLIPLIYTIFGSLVGMVVAIHHPKLKWQNETEAVKNSITVLISFLINFGFTMILSALLIVLPLLLPSIPYLGELIALVLIVIATIPLYIYLHKNFAKKIEEIEDL